MFKFTRKYQNDKVEKLQERKTKIYNCLTTYEKKIEMYDINDRSQTISYVTCVLLIGGFKKEIELLEKEIKGIKASLASTYRKKNVSKKDLEVTVNGDNLTTSEASSTVVNGSNSCQNNNSSGIGLGLNIELVETLRKQKAKLEGENIEDIPAVNGHQQLLDSDLKKEEENKPSIFQQQLWDQITKMKNRNKIQGVNLTENSLVVSGDATVVHNNVMDSNQVRISPAQQQKLYNNLTADCPLFLLDASDENSDDGNIRLKYLSMILEDEEDDDDEEAGMARCISVIRKEQFSSLRKSIISLKSEFGLDEKASLCEFEELEQMIAEAEAENEVQQQNSEKKLIADLPVSQLFFKSTDSNVTVGPAPVLCDTRIRF